MNQLDNLSKAKNKEDLIYITRNILRDDYKLNISEDIIFKIINVRSSTIRRGIENGVKRIIIPKIGRKGIYNYRQLSERIQSFSY